MRRRGDEGRIVTVDDRDEDAAKRGAGNTFADRIGVEKSRLAQRERM